MSLFDNFPWSQKNLKEKEVDNIVHKDLKKIQEKFQKVCINAHSVDKVYKNPDYTKWAKEAKERGELYFYTELVDPRKPFGSKRLCKPKYEYRLTSPLTVEEYNIIFPEK